MDSTLLGVFLADMIAPKAAKEPGDPTDATAWQYLATRLATADWAAMQLYFSEAPPGTAT